MNVLIAQLNDGRRCLGKLYKGEVVPASYANRTQAQLALARVGPGWFVRFQRPFYVMKEADHE